jgi:hypothetical protein
MLANCVRGLHNSDVEADVALSRYAPSGPRSLTPVVRPTGPRTTRSNRTILCVGQRRERYRVGTPAVEQTGWPNVLASMSCGVRFSCYVLPRRGSHDQGGSLGRLVTAFFPAAAESLSELPISCDRAGEFASSNCCSLPKTVPPVDVSERVGAGASRNGLQHERR